MSTPSAPSDRFPNTRIALLPPAVDSAQKIQISGAHPNMSRILAEVRLTRPVLGVFLSKIRVKMTLTHP